MRTGKLLEKFLWYTGIFLLVISINSCSDDDDGSPSNPVEMIQVEDNQDLQENSITVLKVVVNQDSWLVALSDESSNELIAEPVWLPAGTHSNVEVKFHDYAIKNRGSGQQVVLMLFSDNQNEGIKGEWDSADEPIKSRLDENIKKVLIVFGEYDPFAFYDDNNDGILTLLEVSKTYINQFTELWDADGNESLSQTEFYYTTFLNTDVDMNLIISEEEWNNGYTSMFSNWADNNFLTLDENDDEHLDEEEWNEYFIASQWFETYDANNDSSVTEVEWYTGLFGDWDLDNDGVIAREEFDNYYIHAQNWYEYTDW